MDPGSVAPCSAHDILGGFGKVDISQILKDLSRQNKDTWIFLQNGLLSLKAILRHKGCSKSFFFNNCVEACWRGSMLARQHF